MGMELEYKLHVPDESVLLHVLAAPEIEALRAAPWKQTRMRTTYFDTPDGRFSALRWTLRRRMENETSVVCLKTPLPGQTARGEWQLEADEIDRATIDRLQALGAPRELEALFGDGVLVPVCGAEFLRRSVMLEFPDGSRAELAGDHGRLFGATESAVFTELELELYGGAPAATRALADALCQAYGLHDEPKSKLARARALK
mgnify:CR=1 FL=1